MHTTATSAYTTHRHIHQHCIQLVCGLASCDMHQSHCVASVCLRTSKVQVPCCINPLQGRDVNWLHMAIQV